MVKKATAVDEATKKVTVCQVGAADTTVTVEDGATIRSVLEAAGLIPEDYTVRCEGDEYGLDDEPVDGDELFVAKAGGVKGA